MSLPSLDGALNTEIFNIAFLRGWGGKKSNQGRSTIFPSKQRPSVSPELSLGLLRVWEGWEEKGPSEQKGKYLFNSNKTRSLPRNAPPAPHLLYREKSKTMSAEAHSWSRCFQFFTAHNSSSSPPAAPPALSAGIQRWEVMPRDGVEPFPGARAVLRSSHSTIAPKLTH